MEKQTSKKDSPDGLWNACADMELTAILVLSKKLAAFNTGFRDLYEAGTQAPTLPAQRKSDIEMRVAALFLKRCLTDLRGVWLLVVSGYTSQAAAVAASLYENALAVTCIARSTLHAQRFLNSKDGDLPLTPVQLAQFQAHLAG